VFTALVNAGSMDVWKRDPNVGVAAFRNHMLNSYDDVKKKVVKEKNEIKKQTKFKEQYSGSLFDSFGSVDI
jgi:hypothetical protein